MEEKTKEAEIVNKQVWVSSLKTAAKVLSVCLVAVFYLMSVSFFVFPKTSAKIFNFLGLKKAEESCYVQAYENSGKIEDLYNLVLFEQQCENYEKELYYINVLMKFDGYVEFCEKLDKSAISNIKSTEKYMISYVGDTNAYLTNRKIKCMYSLNLRNSYDNRSNSVMEFVRQQLKSGDLKETSFYTYVTLVCSDATLTDSQKKETLTTLYNLTSTNIVDETEYLIDLRIKNLNDMIDECDKIEDKILLQNALVKIHKAHYHLSEQVGRDDSDLTEIEEAYDLAVQDYNNMIK